MENYKFYLGFGGSQLPVNLETHYRCKYVKMTNVLEKGEVKNMYFESYAETDGDRVLIPDYPTHKSTECQLTLLFNSETAIADSLELVSDLEGKVFQWHDTFRGVYLLLALEKPTPTIGHECLYKDLKLRELTFTFKNVRGTYSTTSYIGYPRL